SRASASRSPKRPPKPASAWRSAATRRAAPSSSPSPSRPRRVSPSCSDGRATLQAALEALCADPLAPAANGARLALGRLHDAAGDGARARVHYAIGTFLDPTGLAAARWKELGPPEPWSIDPEALVHPSARGPLRDALVALAPHL